MAGVVETIAASCAPVVGTEDDLEIATDLPPDAAAKTLRRWGADQVIIKRGAYGPSFVGADSATSASGSKVQVEDDMSAGDAILSACLDACLARSGGG